MSATFPLILMSSFTNPLVTECLAKTKAITLQSGSVLGKKLNQNLSNSNGGNQAYRTVSELC